MFKKMQIVLLGILLSVTPVALGQAPAGGEDTGKEASTLEFGIHLGTFLPDQISGMTEVTGLGGFRGGYRLSAATVAEMTLAMGSGDGASYRNLAMDLRFDVPVESFVTFVFLGLDATHYKGVGQDWLLVGGGNIGGGIMTQVGGSFWLRSDMKFTFNPGDSLYFNVSIMFRI